MSGRAKAPGHVLGIRQGGRTDGTQKAKRSAALYGKSDRTFRGGVSRSHGAFAVRRGGFAAAVPRGSNACKPHCCAGMGAGPCKSGSARRFGGRIAVADVRGPARNADAPAPFAQAAAGRAAVAVFASVFGRRLFGESAHGAFAKAVGRVHTLHAARCSAPCRPCSRSSGCAGPFKQRSPAGARGSRSLYPA